ncbi:hypothetical protein D3C71_2034370 [compost metagenome]
MPAGAQVPVDQQRRTPVQRGLVHQPPQCLQIAVVVGACSKDVPCGGRGIGQVDLHDCLGTGFDVVVGSHVGRGWIRRPAR